MILNRIKEKVSKIEKLKINKTTKLEILEFELNNEKDKISSIYKKISILWILIIIITLVVNINSISVKNENREIENIIEIIDEAGKFKTNEILNKWIVNNDDKSMLSLVDDIKNEKNYEIKENISKVTKYILVSIIILMFLWYLICKIYIHEKIIFILENSILKQKLWKKYEKKDFKISPFN